MHLMTMFLIMSEMMKLPPSVSTVVAPLIAHATEPVKNAEEGVMNIKTWYERLIEAEPTWASWPAEGSAVWEVGNSYKEDEIADLRAALKESRLTSCDIAVLCEAAQVLESAAAHNRSQGRTVFAHEQQQRAEKLRGIITRHEVK